MRLTLLTLVMGMLLGFVAHALMVEHPQWFFASARAQPSAPAITQPASTGPAKPFVYPKREDTLARLRKQFDEAVVVVLADESYDNHYKLVHISVVEVWKGPAHLVGKSMDSRLEAPLSYTHSKHSERVLRFMPMSPRLDSAGSIFFTGDVLRMNPALTVSSLKAALLNTKENNG